MVMNFCTSQVDISHMRSENSQVSDNQEIVKILIDILILYLLKYGVLVVIKIL